MNHRAFHGGLFHTVATYRRQQAPRILEAVNEQNSLPQGAPQVNKHAPDPAKPIVAKKSALTQFLSMNLVLEACVVLFATVVAAKFASIDRIKIDLTLLWVMGGVLILLMLVASRMQGSPMGRYFGSVLQVPFLLMGAYVDLMYVVAVVFIAIWVASWILGRKIDRERAEYDAAHPETAPNKF